RPTRTMTYTLQGILAKPTSAILTMFVDSVVELEHDVALIPFTDRFRERHGIPSLSLGPKSRELPRSIAKIVQMASKDDRAAYVEAEFWAGIGGQAASVWERAVAVGDVIVSGEAINEALRFLQVQHAAGADDFHPDALGMHG